MKRGVVIGQSIHPRDICRHDPGAKLYYPFRLCTLRICAAAACLSTTPRELTVSWWITSALPFNTKTDRQPTRGPDWATAHLALALGFRGGRGWKWREGDAEGPDGLWAAAVVTDFHLVPREAVPQMLRIQEGVLGAQAFPSSVPTFPTSDILNE